MAAAPSALVSPGTNRPLLYGNWTPALFRPHARSIGGIVAEVTIEEQGEDELQITEHPVEQGAPIADHAFKRPSTVTIRAGWSVQRSLDLSAETGVYGLLLSWQASLLPFDLITGKRSYANMLIERLSVQTDQHSEWALMATIVCRQVIIVGTQTTQVEGQSQSQGDQQNPASTTPQKDNGDKPSTDVGTAYPPLQDPNATPADYPIGPSGQPDLQTPADYELGPGAASANAVATQLNANGAAPAADPPGPTPGALDLGGNPQAGIISSTPTPAAR